MADISYVLVDNKLTPDPNDLRAQVQISGTAGIEDLANDVVRPGSTVTKAEFLAMYEEFKTAALRRVLRGENVVTDLFILRPGLAGVWRDANDTFDPTRHHGQINLSAGTFLRRAEPDMKFTLVRAGRALSEPFPETLEDFTSDKTDDTLTKGGIARLSGSSLKHDPADLTQGVFLVRSNGTTTRVDTYKTNKPSEQLFVVPAALTAGTYRLEVRSKLKDSNQLKTGQLAATLTVA